MTIEVIGVHPVEAAEPVYLVELRVSGLTDSFEVGAITQEIAGEPESNWQVPWKERFLNPNGTAVVEPIGPAGLREIEDIRLAFFFHCLHLDRPLLTAAGPVALPPPSGRPARLSFLEYESPC